MKQGTSPKKSFWPWVYVGLCSLSIFLIVPLARAIRTYVSGRWGRSMFGYAVLAAIGLAFVLIILVFIFKLRVRSPANFVWLVLVAGLYVYFTLRLWRSPEEAVHFLEYGLLGFFLFRALRPSCPDPGIYLAAFFIGALVGTFDEILQWIVPGRYWDFRDVGFNALSSGLFQIALFKGVRPALPSLKISKKSWRKVFLLAAILITLLCLCAFNTPQRTSRLARAVPALSPLLKEEPMYEFSNRYRDPEIGKFYSRVKPEELAKRDAETAADNGRILNEWKGRAYKDFLSNFSPYMHTVLYEFRVHVFRRDRMLEEGRKAGAGKARKTALLAAYKENLILERYFPETLRLSPYAWGGETAEALETEIDPSLPYRSPVSAGSVIVVSERVLWSVLIFGWLLYISFSTFTRPRTKKTEA